MFAPEEKGVAAGDGFEPPIRMQPKEVLIYNHLRRIGISTKFYDEILAPAGLVEARPKAVAKIAGKGRDASVLESPVRILF